MCVYVGVAEGGTSGLKSYQRLENQENYTVNKWFYISSLFYITPSVINNGERKKIWLYCNKEMFLK